MAERLHPGVYVEEVSSGVRPIEGVGTSTAAFVGVAARGVPGLATLLTSFDDYIDAFGGHLPADRGYMSMAAQAFFDAGGRRAYAVRVLPKSALAAQQETAQPTRFTTAGTPAPALQFFARGKGAWAGNLRVEIDDGTNFGADAFKVTVLWIENGLSRTLEIFDDIRMDPDHEDYFAEVINEGSRYIKVTDEFAKANDGNTGAITPVPEAVPGLQVRSLPASDRYTVHQGAVLEFTWTDAAGGAPRTKSVPVTGLTFGADGTAKLTRTNLKDFLTAGLGADFRVTMGTGTVGPLVEPKIATRGKLTVDPKTAWPVDLSADTLTVTIDDVDTVMKMSDEAPTPSAVSAADLVTVLRRRLGADNPVDLVGDTISIRTAASATAKMPAMTQVGTLLTINAAVGLAGALVESLDGITITVSEAPTRTFGQTLGDLEMPVRSRGYEQNSAANPIVRPTATAGTAVRLVGGWDGEGALTDSDYKGDPDLGTGLHALDRVDVNIVALPGQNAAGYLSAGIAYCDGRGDCFFLADGPGHLDDDLAVKPKDAKDFVQSMPNRSKNAAMFYPWIEVSDPVGAGRNPKRFVPPSGHIAGIFARTDISRGVWKAPAGIEAVVSGAIGVQYELVDAEQDVLNPVSLNCIRRFPGAGIVSWGTRTLSADPEWRYVPVRRTALFLKESLRRGLQWAVFEPNDQELWDRVRLNIESFMLGLFKQGAFQGSSPDEAFTVVCDRSTNPQALVDQGVVTAQVAFAPLKPAEFVVIQISQKTLVGG